MKKDTYYRLCRLKLLCVGVLNFEPTNVILKNEAKSAKVYARRVNVYPFPLRRSEHQKRELTRMYPKPGMAVLHQLRGLDRRI